MGILGNALSTLTEEKAAKNHQHYPWRIINVILQKVSKRPTDSINSRTKTVEVRARGFQNRQCFSNANDFYLGALDLYSDDSPK